MVSCPVHVYAQKEGVMFLAFDPREGHLATSMRLLHLEMDATPTFMIFDDFLMLPK
jgi:hypothetical protein